MNLNAAALRRFPFRAGRIGCLLLGLFLLPGYAFSAPGEDNEGSVFSRVKWQRGPSKAGMGTIAEIEVPDGYIFAGGDDTRLLMEALHNPINGNELGFFAPTSLVWFVVFEFSEVGYVRDDERDKLDADKMLASIQQATERSNKQRAKHGWPPLEIIGWEQAPFYEPESHNLTWAIRAQSLGEPVVNYNTRLLGRRGVMSVALVLTPEQLAETVPVFKSALRTYSFKPGGRYAEYRQGDKIARYGLTALVAGGATAVAMKTGLFKYLWKALVLGTAAIAAFFKKLFGRRSSQESVRWKLPGE
jgi:uncharacterized membrane-anchored protein